ncbi:hypothetical protein [Rhodococcus sp. NPDC004095]
MSDYKIETKPTLWEVSLNQGAYSDRTEEHYFLRANDRLEAWNLFKKFWSDIIDVKDTHRYSRGNLLVYVDADGVEAERFKPEKWAASWNDNDDEPDYDIYYGSAWEVQLNQLAVVEFLR